MKHNGIKIPKLWMLLLPALISALSVHSVGNSQIKESSDISVEERGIFESTELKILRLGLIHTHDIRYSRASWYGDIFHGRTTANNEIFNKNHLTCAHKSLPLNTYILVTNLNNDKTLVVRVNDRGPFVVGRELDLSEAAAKVIGAHNNGVIPIRYEVLVRA